MGLWGLNCGLWLICRIFQSRPQEPCPWSLRNQSLHSDAPLSRPRHHHIASAVRTQKQLNNLASTCKFDDRAGADVRAMLVDLKLLVL